MKTPPTFDHIALTVPDLDAQIDRLQRDFGMSVQSRFGDFAVVADPATGVFHANGMLAITLAGDRIRAMTRFDNSVIARFGLPRRLP